MSTAAQLLAELSAQFADALTVTPTTLGDDYAHFYTANILTDPTTGALTLHLLGHSPLQATSHTAALTALATRHGAKLKRNKIDATTMNTLLTTTKGYRSTLLPTSAKATATASPDGPGRKPGAPGPKSKRKTSKE